MRIHPAQEHDFSAQQRSAVEAVLWVAEGPMTPAKIAKAAGLTGPAEALEALQGLRQTLAQRGSALEIVDVAGGVRLTTRPEFSPWIERFTAGAGAPERGPRLSSAAGETLAIIAYRQPIVRAEIEAIRGVGCGEVLRQLLDADLLRIVGRTEELGRPLLYGTTGRFLELYGLGSLERLPGRDEGSPHAGPTTQNANAA